jgi:hypothetical protein
MGLFLVDVRGNPLGFRYRLVGTAIGQLAGREYTGLSVDRRDYGYNWKEVFDDYAAVVSRREPSLRQGRAPWAGREFLSYERIVAPLSSDGEAIDMLFGALHCPEIIS